MDIAWPGGSWQETLKIVAFVLGVFLAALWLTVVYWTYRDIRQRTRDSILQLLAVLLVLAFSFPGHWIYLILRPRYTLTELYERSLEEEALLQDLEEQKACPTCRRRVKDEFLVCPTCRTQLRELCRTCNKPLSFAWLACPYCGLEKAPRETLAVRAPGRRGPRAVQPPQPAYQEELLQQRTGRINRAAQQVEDVPPADRVERHTRVERVRPAEKGPLLEPVTLPEPPTKAANGAPRDPFARPRRNVEEPVIDAGNE